MYIDYRKMHIFSKDYEKLKLSQVQKKTRNKLNFQI